LIRYALISLLFLFPAVDAKPQAYLGFSAESEFITHLLNTGEYKNAIYLLKKMESKDMSPAQKDSLNYFMGWAYYNRVMVDSSALYLSKVSSASGFYYKSTYYYAIELAYMKRYDESIDLLKKNGLADTNITSAQYANVTFRQLKDFELAGFYLLTKSYSKFDSVSRAFDQSYYAFANEQKDLKGYAFKMKNYKRKSPFLAATLSTLVPGLGKFYAGKKGQSLATFSFCAVLGAATAENYIRGGARSPGFIIFGTFFSMFYLGNIWGSAVSVKIARDSFYKTKENEILVSLHIPLRRIFN
jgi:hypothetical protein